jgi:hypothetical protein
MEPEGINVTNNLVQQSYIHPVQLCFSGQHPQEQPLVLHGGSVALWYQLRHPSLRRTGKLEVLGGLKQWKVQMMSTKNVRISLRLYIFPTLFGVTFISREPHRDHVRLCPAFLFWVGTSLQNNRELSL